MYKVKIFDEEHEMDLQDSINEFLEEVTELIDIKYSISSMLSNKGEQIHSYSALIIYK